MNTTRMANLHSRSLIVMLRRFLRSLQVSNRHTRLIALLLMLTIVSVSITVSIFQVQLKVFINGKCIGYFDNELQLQHALHTLENSAESYLGHPYAFTPKISYELTWFNHSESLSKAELETFLLSQVDGLSTSYALRVDDELILANDDKDILKTALNKILEEYSNANSLNENSTVHFVQDVSIAEEILPSEYICSYSEIKQILTSPKKKAQNYIIQNGDTFYALALKFGMTIDTLEEINPSVAPEALQIGQTVTTFKEVPLLSIEEVRTCTYSEDIPFETHTVESDKLYTNQSKIQVHGQNGKKEVTATIILRDGIELSRTTISETVLTEPIAEVLYVGTIVPPPKEPTGTYIRPAAGYLSSNYGYRGTEFHTGVDFASSIGTSIFAADGGKVIYSGRKGNYGKCIIIDHGNGLHTYYAHCSSLLVHVGEKVAQGEQIAKMGSTGRSTGPHLHFEVRLNGKHVNPWNYID